jgi:hypothetical protein
MKNNYLTTISLLTLLGTYATTCSADALDDLLKQLEQAELKPAAKKAPPAAEAHEPHAKPPRTPTKPLAAPMAEEPTAPSPLPRPVPGASKREQRIMSFFQTQISPIAEGMFKLVESKETQQLVETAKKKRIEREKAAVGKMAKGPAAKPRYTTVGGGAPGRSGGFGAPGRGFDPGLGGLGGFGKGSWASSTSALGDKSTATKPFESPTSKLDTAKTTGPSTATSDSGGARYSTPKEKEKDEFAGERQHVLNLSKAIQETLASWTDKLERSPNRNLVFTQIANSKAIKGLKNKFESRDKALSEEGKLPPTEVARLKDEIIKAEKSAWDRLFDYDTNYKHYLAAQPILKQLEDSSLIDLLKKQKIIADGAGGSALDSEAQARLQKLQQALNALGADAQPIPAQLPRLKERLVQRLQDPSKVLSDAAPVELTTENLKKDLEAIKPEFSEAEYIEFRPEIERFFSTPTTP